MKATATATKLVGGVPRSKALNIKFSSLTCCTRDGGRPTGGGFQE